MPFITFWWNEGLTLGKCSFHDFWEKDRSGDFFLSFHLRNSFLIWPTSVPVADSSNTLSFWACYCAHYRREQRWEAAAAGGSSGYRSCFKVWNMPEVMLWLKGNIKYTTDSDRRDCFWRQVGSVFRKLLACPGPALVLQDPRMSLWCEDADRLDGRLWAPARSPGDMIYGQSCRGCWATSHCGPPPL